MIAKGRGKSIPSQDPKADDIYMFSYTSGTTGDPKGVKLSHKMILGCGYATNQHLVNAAGGNLTEHDTYVSYLPAAHSFE